MDLIFQSLPLECEPRVSRDFFVFPGCISSSNNSVWHIFGNQQIMKVTFATSPNAHAIPRGGPVNCLLCVFRHFLLHIYILMEGPIKIDAIHFNEVLGYFYRTLKKVTGFQF